MFFKKKKVIINSKYKLKDFVHFNYKGDIKYGHIREIKETPLGILYDIQVGGECPSILKDIPEKIVFLNEK